MIPISDPTRPAIPDPVFSRPSVPALASSREVPPPDDAVLDLQRPLPPGTYALVVRDGKTTVVHLARLGVSEQLISVPVANAEALMGYATYVVLATVGALPPAPCLYGAPDWLVRQVVPTIMEAEA